MSDDDPTIRIGRADVHDTPTVTPSPRAGTSRAAFEPEEIVAGRYRIVRFIARGGMGEVYEAEDLELHDVVALKTILPEVAEDPNAVERFRREIQIARKVTHPNVCRVFDVAYGESGVMFVTMELLAGETLRQRIVQSGPLSTSDALPIARQIADGLAAAHRAGVIHRDLKSGNVMLVAQNGETRAVITDFGLARASIVGDRTITNTGEMLGSPGYMSPEQIEGQTLTPATDIYAFGVVLYEMVTRSHPFEAETTLASVLKRLREPATSPRAHVPDLDPAWEHAILRCLEKNPDDRFTDARDVITALESGTTATLPSRRRARFRGLAIALGILIVIAAIIALVPWKRVSLTPSTPAPQTIAARRAIAVLGFRNQSGPSDAAWLSAALTEMLTTEVAAAEQVRTIPGDRVAQTKRELGLGDALTAPALARIRNVLGTDYAVSGSYVALGDQLRVDVQLQEALGGNVLASFSETGDEQHLFDLVSRLGTRLRQKLGVASVTPEAASGILASLPSNPMAVRYYTEGLSAMRAYDNLGARTLFEKAIAADSAFPLAHAALADVYRSLGYDKLAKEEIRIALEKTTKLPRESRLSIEAQAHAVNDRFAQAAEIYQALWRFYPDNLDYATRTAFALVNAGKAKDALAMIDALKKTWNDPQLDIAEADAAHETSDYQRERTAALRALQKADARGQRLLGARARLNEGYALLRMSQLPAALAAFEDCKRRYESVGDRMGVAGAMGGIGSVLIDQEKLDEALVIFEEQAKIAHETGARASEASDLHNVAYVLQKKGDLAGAKATLRRALELQQGIAKPAEVAGTLDLLGTINNESGDLAAAMKFYEEALAINEQIGAVHAAANNRNNLAIIHNAKGDLEESERLFEQALAAYRATHDDAGAADALNNLASTQRTRGEIDAAEKSYAEAEQVYRRMNSKSDLALIAVNVSTIRLDRGDLAGAKKQAEAALAIWRSTGEKSYVGYALMAVADVEAKRGDLARAEAIVRESLQLRQQMGEQSTAAESQLWLADIALEQNRLDDAESLARSALAVFAKEDRADMIASADAILARIAIARGNLSAARSLLQSAPSSQFAVELTEAKLATASGKPLIAIQQLTKLLDRVSKQGLVPQQFDARLALAEANIAAGRDAVAREQLEALEWDANNRGFGLMVRKAQIMKRAPAARG